MTDPAHRAMSFVASLAPVGQTLTWANSLEADESHWFMRSVEAGVVRFCMCGPECVRFKKWGVAGPDHFDTPTGKARHLYSKPVGDTAWLNREYVPHIAAYGRAIVELAYRQDASSFSRYRTFRRDLITKHAGQAYETDAEFYNARGDIYLHLEAKKDRRATDAVVAAVERSRQLSAPDRVAKELEYVLDLAPRYLWLVGPGSVEPATHVYAVEVSGLDARFEPQASFPPPPTT